jgi:hypothetical protein
MSKTLKVWLIIAIVVILLAVGGYFFYQQQHAKFVKLDAFAKCLKDSGALFYGAFWCPHCQNQKNDFNTFFESAKDSLPYVECSTPDGRGQLQVCKDQDIKAYPTWKFADGSVETGELSFARLAEKTKCVAP